MSATGEWLYVLRPVRAAMVVDGPNADERPILESHVRRLRELAGQGVLRWAGRTQNADAAGFGIIVFRADSEERARRLMESDPAVEGGIMTAELFPFRVAVEE